MKEKLLPLIAVWLIACLNAQAQNQFCTYTGITGFWDYQSNYRTPQYLRACPGSTMLHAIMMVADDSLSTSTSRRTAYAFSSNGGTTWTTFSQIRVPDRRSGYPSLDIGQAAIACGPIIANHSTIAGALQSTAFVDYPPGSGGFSELASPIVLGGDEPGFPEIAGAADGSIVLVASRFAAGSVHVTRTADYVSWQPWSVLTLDFSSDGYVAEANSTGRVGVVVTAPEDTLSWYESTNNGTTWPATPTQLLPDLIPMGGDTFVIQQGLDLVYLSNDTLVAFGVTKLVAGNPTSRHQGIGFWSELTGFVLAVPHDSVTGVVDTLRKRQVNQNTVTGPAIGLSGSTIVIAFQAFMPETSAAGFNYSDIFFTYSTNRGRNWSRPENHTATRFLDERYASMSKWNVPGQANMVYQEDPQPGSAVFTDNSPLARVRQVFCRRSGIPITSVSGEQEVPKEFLLSQNYPNPFNPITEIEYSLPSLSSNQAKGRVGEGSHVTLIVYDVLGREVATLVNEEKPPGTYEVTFDASGFSSGVYFYRLSTTHFVQTRKLVLLR